MNREPRKQIVASVPHNTSTELYQVLFEQAADGIFIADAQGCFTEVNRRGCEMLGYTREEMLALSIEDLIPAEDLARDPLRLGDFRTGKTVLKERRLRTKYGHLLPVEINARMLSGGSLLGMVRDITEHKRVQSIMQARLRLLEFASSHSMDELLTATLDEIEALTGSTIGFYHFLEADQKTLSLQNWSTNTLKNMCTAEGKGCHYDVAQAGVWVDCVYERRPVIHNDYASLPHRKGLPEGHAPVVREVVVPIFRGNLIKAIIGVGNKSTHYNESDIEIVSQLGDLSWDIAERKRAEEALKEQYSTLRSIIDSANALVFSVDRHYRYTSFNKGHAAVMKALYGVEIETGHSLLDYMTVSEDREAARRNLDRALAGEQLMEEAYSGEELRLRRYFQVSHSPVKSEEGQVIGVAVLAQDMTEHKQAEEALRQSEQRKTILNQIANIFLTVPDDEMYAEVLAVVLQVMKSEFGLFGFIGANNDLVIPSLTREIWNECQVSDKSIVFPPDTWGDSLWGRAIREKKTFYSDGPFHIPEGHIHIDNFLTAPIVFGNETIGIISVANNERGYTEENKDLLEGIASYISPILNARLQRDQQEQERKRAEEALRESEEKFRTIIEQSTEGVVLIDEEGNIVEWNQANERMTGLRRDEVIGMPFWNMVMKTAAPERQTSQRREFIRAAVLEALQTGQSYLFAAPIEIEFYPQPGKEKRYMHQIIFPIKTEKGYRLASLTHDITERKQVERELQRSNNLLRAIIEAAPTAIIGLDLDGNVQAVWNPAAEKMLGWSVQEVMGHPLPNVPVESQEEFRRFREMIRSGKTLDDVEVRRQRHDGTPIDYSIYASPLRDAEGQITGNIAVLVDITERKRAEEEIRKLNQELEQRVADRTAQLEAVNNELEAFAYSVSHDLRAPLRHINGFLELLQKSLTGALGERSQHYMDTISDSAKRMGTLIDDLLSFSRMGRYEMSKMQVDLGGLVQEIIQELEPETRGRTIDWRIADLPTVTGDRAMLRLALVNLISNALKFTRLHPQAGIEIGCLPRRGTETVVFIRDNGVGFDMAYADKLFGVFQRLHRADEFEGTGIGLANVRRIIHRHGGRTWAEGQVNQGATFYISLPQAFQET